MISIAINKSVKGIRNSAFFSLRACRLTVPLCRIIAVIAAKLQYWRVAKLFSAITFVKKNEVVSDDLIYKQNLRYSRSTTTNTTDEKN
jgi:hypothetical protein